GPSLPRYRYPIAGSAGLFQLKSCRTSASAAGPADKPRLEVGQPHSVGPAIVAQGDVVAASIVLAVDQDAAHAHVAHPAEGDLDWAVCGSRGGQAWASRYKSGDVTASQIIDS